MIEHLRDIVDQAALDAIEAEICTQVGKMYQLALNHYRFSKKLERRDWRQKVSRLYYASYSASRAVRLHTSGSHSTDVKDHQKIGDLPQDFPGLAQFKNQLEVLREDRNTCDYDQTALAADLVISPEKAEELVGNFLLQVKIYLKNRGLQIRGTP